MRERIGTIAIVLLAIATCAFFYKRYHIPPHVDIPSVIATDMNGRSVSLTTYSAHPLFISFFATWCGPCLRELPTLATLHDRLSDQHLNIVCISDAPIENLKQLESRYKGRLVFLHVEDLHAIGIYTYPTNYIYNTSGQKIYDKVNAERWDDPVLVDQIRKKL